MVNINSKWIPACRFHNKRYQCLKTSHRYSFYWDRYTMRNCDIHAPFSELSTCVSTKISFFRGNAHFITFIRNPVNRYISEFHHVQRGATWYKAIRKCNEQLIHKNKCYQKSDWKNVTWEEFTKCKYNLGNNRQVRMLADYNKIGCEALKCLTGTCTYHDAYKYERKLLESAKHTLSNMPFFGITEYQELSQYLFEKTYKSFFKFSVRLQQSNETLGENYQKITIENETKKVNKLDIEFYDFALKLFFKRIGYFKSQKAFG